MREACGRCGEGPAITVIVEGVRLCAVCRDKWLAEESEDLAAARETGGEGLLTGSDQSEAIARSHVQASSR